MLFLLLALMIDGPISKFVDHKIDADFDTSASMGDIERCLIDTNAGLPNVYRQPDRPDDVTLLWSVKGPFTSIVASRIDLHQTAAGTHVKSWSAADIARKCAAP